MKTRDRIYTGLLIAACTISAAGCAQAPSGNVGFTAGRASATLIAVVGLIGTVFGGLALRAAGRRAGGSAGAVTALALGLIATVLSVVHLGTSTGGFGTGGGRAGAIVALVLGLVGVSLGGLALARARRANSTD